MLTKDQILNNIRVYSASEIAEAIRKGNVSLYELSKSGKLSPLLKKRIEDNLASIQEETEDSELPFEARLVEAISDSQIESSSVIQNPQTEIAIPPTFVNSTNAEYSFSNDVVDNSGMFKRVFSFKGRIRRLEYGLLYIFFIIWYIIFMSITEMNDPNPFLALLAILSIVPAYWYLWAQGAKRCHDRGNSGWYQIIPFYFIIMIFGGSDEGSNEYGTNPKEKNLTKYVK